MTSQFPTPNNDLHPNLTSVTLAGQLFLSHFVAAGAAWLTAVNLQSLTTGWLPLGMAVGGVVGLLLTANLQRGVRLLDWSLWRLTELLPIADLPQRRFGPLAGLMAKLRVLAERERPFTELREIQTRQASDAAAQAERNRLARDLHDSIKQQLFAIQVGAATVQARWEQDDDGAKAALADVRAGAQAAMVEMNAMLHQLAPVPLENIGLVEALREQGQALAYRTGAEVTTEFGPLPPDEQFPDGAQTAIFRIAQEALSNAARHARAHQISLSLKASETAVHLEIRDDGQGFDPAAGGEGMGLPNMRQRAAELGGEFVFASEIGAGTAVRVTMPLQESDAMKEMRMDKPDHLLNRISLAGLVGGLLLFVVLYYPVYVALPGRVMTDWRDGSILWATFLVFLGLSVLSFTGYWAAVRAQLGTRRGNGLAGMFAGGLAAWIAYFSLVGAGTAVLGNADLFANGAAAADSDEALVWLIAQGTMGVVNWSYGGMTAVTLVGLASGWLGGWATLVGTANRERNWLRQWDNLGGIGVAFTFSSLLTLVVTVFLYAPLGVELKKAVDDSVAAGFAINQSAVWADVVPLVTAFVMYLVGLTAVSLILRRTQRGEDAHYRWNSRLAGFMNAGVAVILPLLLLPITTFSTPAFRSLILAGSSISLGLGLWLLRHTLKVAEAEGAGWRQWAEWGFYGAAVTAVLLAWLELTWIGLLLLVIATFTLIASRDKKPLASKPEPARLLAQTFEVFLPGTLALVLPTMVLSSPALGLVMLVVSAVPHLTPGGNPMAAGFWQGQISQLFVTQRIMFLVTILFGSLLIGIVVGVVRLALGRAMRKMA